MELLRNDIVPAIQNAAADQNINMAEVYFQQDGASVHYSVLVRNYLNNEFPERWIGRGGPIKWPARSPDLTPLDFFLWGYLKDEVFRTPPADLIELQDRIVQKCASITTDTLKRVLNSFEARMFVCMEQNGAQFEHLL